MDIIVSAKACEVVREAVWLAWKASAVEGMGIFKDWPGATKEDVWQNVMSCGDYPCRAAGSKDEGGKGCAVADYVFGRMMKLTLWWDDRKCCVTVPDAPLKWDYQSWSGRYKSYGDLIAWADKSLAEQAKGGAGT